MFLYLVLGLMFYSLTQFISKTDVYAHLDEEVHGLYRKKIINSRILKRRAFLLHVEGIMNYANKVWQSRRPNRSSVMDS